MNLLTSLLCMGAIIDHEDWSLSQRGEKDAERHREKIDDSIRKNMRDVISEESIITSKRGRKVRIPVRGLRDYRFIYGDQGQGGAGVGQGEGEEGEVIGQEPKKQPGEPGGEGHEWMETEVDIDYLIELMFEDLGLPWIEEKTKKEHLIPKGWKFETISKRGILPRLHKRKTMIEAAKRMMAYVYEIMDATGCTEEVANKALMKTEGELNEAIEFVKSGKPNGELEGIFIEDDDLRFKQIEEDVEIHSNAVVIAMMDVSASMTPDKKYLARSMLFWMTEFLRKMYSNVEIKFIQHTTIAEVVSEEDFFTKSPFGGTKCYTAFEKASYLIETEFPVDEWNVYCVYISDGEDFEPDMTLVKIQELLNKKINMLSYCELDIKDNSPYSYGDYRVLLKKILENWKFDKREEAGTTFYRSDRYKFLLSVIKEKDHIYPALRHMLFEKA